VTDDAGKPVDVSAALRPDTAEGEAEAAGEAAAETGTAEAEAELAAEADAEAAAEAAAEAGAEPVAEAAPAVDADGADQDETPKKKATRKAAKK
jgi:fused signal recognition particle receptor